MNIQRLITKNPLITKFIIAVVATLVATLIGVFVGSAFGTLAVLVLLYVFDGTEFIMDILGYEWDTFEPEDNSESILT